MTHTKTNVHPKPKNSLREYMFIAQCQAVVPNPERIVCVVQNHITNTK